MDTTEIIKEALAIVGVTQMLKSFLPFKKGWIWTITTIIVGVVMVFVPIKYLNVVISISGATLFYDTIFQTFEKLFKRLPVSEVTSTSQAESQTDEQDDTQER